MKWLRSILVAIMLVFSCNELTAQNNLTIGSESYNTWMLTSKACYGCSSFFIMIVNNPNPIKGYYYYDIYFWSNSYYANGYAANTYIKQVGVYTIDPAGIERFIFKTPYVVVAPKSNNFNGYFYVGYVYSTSAMQVLKITWLKADVW